MANLDTLSAAQLAAGVAAGDFSATDVARASLEAIDAREPEVQAFLEVSADLALAAAAKTDAARAAGQPLGPLAGVPVAFKDNMHLVGTRTTCASKMLESYQSTFTATCVQRMLDAGATPMGKANMDEFAFGSSTETSAFHRTNNPWDTDARSRRLLGRLGRCRGRRRGHALAGLRHRRLHPPAGGPLRRRGHEAHLRRGLPLRRGGLRLLA